MTRPFPRGSGECVGARPEPLLGIVQADDKAGSECTRHGSTTQMGFEQRQPIRIVPKDSGRERWCRVANNLALYEVDHQLGDVGGMIGHPFKVFGNEGQTNSA